MTENKKRKAAEMIREFYLYSALSKKENLGRIAIWLISGAIGILIPILKWKNVEPLTMMGAYFVFSFPLFIEMLTEMDGKKHKIILLIYGIFCLLLFLLFVGSGFLIFGGLPTEESTETYIQLSTILPSVLFRIFMIALIVPVSCVLIIIFCVDKYFFDLDAEKKKKEEEDAEKEQAAIEAYHKAETGSKGENVR